MWRSVCVVVLLAVLASVARAGSPRGKIAFLREGAVWLIAPDGTGERKIASVGGKAGGLAWDPTGRYLTCTGLPFLPVIDTSTGKVRRLSLPENREDGRLVRLASCGIPVWTRDGGNVLFTGRPSEDADGDGGLWQVDVDGKKPAVRVLPPEDGDVPVWFRPAVGPGQGRLASLDRGAGYADLRIFDIGARKLLRFRPLPEKARVHVTDLAWSDKTVLWLAFDAEQDDIQEMRGPGGVHAWNLHTGSLRPLIETGHTVQSLQPSPDRTRLAYLLRPFTREAEQVAVCTLPGQKIKRITPPGEIRSLEAQAWSHDSHQFLISGYASEKDSEQLLYSAWVVDAASGRSRLLVRNAESPVWSR